MKLKKIITFAVLIILAGAWGALKMKAAKKQVVQENQEMMNRTLYLYAVSNYFPEEIIKKFESLCSCHVQYDYFASNEELLAKLQAGASGYDVLVPSDFIVKALAASQLIIELDKSKIPNLKNIAPEFLGTPYDPENKYTVPFKWGTTGFIYNTDRVKEALNSWDQVFQPKYAGKISLLDDEREAIGSQLLSLGFSVNTVDPEQLDKAKKLFFERKKMVKALSSDPRQLLLSGDVWIAQIYSGDAMQVIHEKPHFKYAINKTGGVIWVDTLAISKGARNVDLAYQFINFMLEPEIEKMHVAKLMYSSPNKEMESANFDESLKPSYTKRLDLTKLEFLKDLGADTQKWDQVWTEIKSQ